MTDQEYGPDKPCRRTKCVETEPGGTPWTAAHLGGVHLDPHDRKHYDGPRVDHVTHRVRPDLYKLLVVKKAHPELSEVIDVAVHSAVKEIDFLGDQATHVRVDADHQVRRALQLGESCEHHGQQIKDLAEQVGALDRDQRRTEAARLALLGLLHTVRTFVDNARANQAAGHPLPDVDAILKALDKAEKQTSAAHDRAWKKGR